MKAIVINEIGSSSQMKCEEIPIPEPGQNEVNISSIITKLKLSYSCVHRASVHSFLIMNSRVVGGKDHRAFGMCCQSVVLKYTNFWSPSS